MADSNELQIKISVPGAQQAAGDVREVARATESVGNAARETSHGVNEGSDALGQFGARGGEARHAVEGLEQATRGGIGGMLGLARAVYVGREAFESLTAMASVGVGVLAIAASKVYEMWKEAKAEEIKANADAAKTHFEQLEKAVENADKAKLEQLTKQIEKLKEAANLAAAGLKALDEARSKLTAAESALAIEKIKNDPTLNAEQKAVKIAAVEQGERDAKRQQEANARDQEQQKVERDVQQAQRLADSAAADKKQRDQEARTAGAAHLASVNAPGQLQAAQAAFQSMEAQGFLSGSPEQRRQINEVFGQINELKELGSDENQAKTSEAAGLAEKRKESADNENERAQKALEEASNTRAKLAAQNTPEIAADRLKTQQAEDALAAAKLSPELAKAKLEDQKRATEKAADAEAANIDAGVGSKYRLPGEASAVAHVREQAQKITENGATAGGLDELSKATMELANAAVAAHDKNAQLLTNTALAVKQQAERLRQVEQQLRDFNASGL